MCYIENIYPSHTCYGETTAKIMVQKFVMRFIYK